MKTLTALLSSMVIIILGIACSDVGGGLKDANTKDGPTDGVNRDAPIVPAVPTLGAQIDRMGRPVINTALTALLNTTAADVTTMKDNYNHAADPATWRTTVVLASSGATIESEFMANLAALDVLDQAGAVGCTNQLLYNGVAAGGGTPAATSYKTLADILADDQLYVDTAKTVCTKYLNLEFDVATGGTVKHTDCGGRAPSNDVGDTSYSLLAAGLAGFSSDGKLTPLVTDGGGATKVVVHTDIMDAAFPFLGPPINP